jgi:hypothetical protein
MGASSTTRGRSPSRSADNHRQSRDLLPRRRQHRCFNLGAEALKRHHPIDHFQWIALRGNRRKPLVRIEKSKLPHRTHVRESLSSQVRLAQIGEASYFSRCPSMIWRAIEVPVIAELLSCFDSLRGCDHGNA